MSGIKELLRSEEDGSLSFGDHTRITKMKLENFKHDGDLYKVKTFKEITRLEKNDSFLYESTPGTTVYNMRLTNKGISFRAEGFEDAQLTLELKEDSEYEIEIDKKRVGTMKTSLTGKLSFSIELDNKTPVQVNVRAI